MFDCGIGYDMDLFVMVVVRVFKVGDFLGVFKCIVFWDDVFVFVLCGIVMV